MDTAIASQIAELRTKAGVALNRCKELAPKIAEDGTAKENFNQAKADLEKFIGSIRSLEGISEIEGHIENIDQPADKVRHRAAVRTEDEEKKLKEAHREALIDYVRFGTQAAYERLKPLYGEARATEIVQGSIEIEDSERHALVGKDLELGGFLLLEDQRTQLIRNLPGYAVVRGAASIKTTSGRAVTWPTITSGTNPYPTNLNQGNTNAANSNWKGEAAYGTDGSAPPRQDKPTFGNVRIPTHLWEPDAIVLARDLVSDSAVNLEGEITGLFAEVKGLDEDWAFINGDGSGKPRGIMWNAGSAPGIAYVAGSHASLLKYTGFVRTYTGLPAQYRAKARWLMNSATYGEALLLETTAGFPLFPPNSLPDTIMTKPVMFSEFMPSIASNAYPIAFGDFGYYYIVDQNEFRIQRLAERYAPHIGLLAFGRTGGQVVRTDAFRLMKISAS